MERVLGIGGLFLRALDPEAMIEWYRDVLGMELGEHGSWEAEAGTTVVAAFPPGTSFPGAAEQQTMLNFRVRDVEAMLAQARAAGADVDAEVQTMDGVGRFGWVTDPAGNRVELWQPL